MWWTKKVLGLVDPSVSQPPIPETETTSRPRGIDLPTRAVMGRRVPLPCLYKTVPGSPPVPPSRSVGVQVVPKGSRTTGVQGLRSTRGSGTGGRGTVGGHRPSLVVLCPSPHLLPRLHGRQVLPSPDPRSSLRPTVPCLPHPVCHTLSTVLRTTPSSYHRPRRETYGTFSLGTVSSRAFLIPDRNDTFPGVPGETRCRLFVGGRVGHHTFPVLCPSRRPRFGPRVLRGLRRVHLFRPGPTPPPPRVHHGER